MSPFSLLPIRESADQISVSIWITSGSGFRLIGSGLRRAATSAPKEMLIQAALSCIIKGAPHELPLNLILFT